MRSASVVKTVSWKDGAARKAEVESSRVSMSTWILMTRRKRKRKQSERSMAKATWSFESSRKGCASMCSARKVTETMMAKASCMTEPGSPAKTAMPVSSHLRPNSISSHQ